MNDDRDEKDDAEVGRNNDDGNDNGDEDDHEKEVQGPIRKMIMKRDGERNKGEAFRSDAKRFYFVTLTDKTEKEIVLDSWIHVQ